MTSTYREYWARKRDSDHSVRAGIDVFRIGAGEIQSYYDAARWPNILEIGCGAGEIFEHLNINRSRYLGVDISATMLDEFRRRHPAVSVEQADAVALRLPRQFDFVIVNNVLQYLAEDEAAQVIRNVAAMLAPTGRAVLANVPDLRLRRIFDREAIRSSSRSLPVRIAAYGLARTQAVFTPKASAGGLGYWHSRERFAVEAARVGLAAYFFGCLLYPYRFTAVLQSSAGSAHP